MLDSGCTNCGDGRPTVCAVCDKYSDDAVKSLAEKHRTERAARLITQAKLENMAIECGVAEGALKRCREERNTLRGDLETTSIELAEAKESLMAARAASKLNSEEALHWGAKYAAEEKAHDSTMQTRDDHEEALNLIFSALGMDEHESEWSSANDPRAIAVERAESLVMERDRFNAVTVAAVKQNCELMDKLVMAQKDAARLRELIIDWSDAVMSTTPRPSESMAARVARRHAVSAALNDAPGASLEKCLACSGTACTENGFMDCTACRGTGLASAGDFIASGEVDGPDGL